MTVISVQAKEPTAAKAFIEVQCLQKPLQPYKSEGLEPGWSAPSGAVSGSVKVFGRLHDDPIHARRRQAFEKRQWTKSREVGRLRCGGLYEGLIGMRTPMRAVERGVMASPSWNQRAPHNPSLLAQILSK